MSTFRKALVAITALAASFATMSSAGAATYPEPTDVQITIDLSFDTLIGGSKLTIQAKAQAGEEMPDGTMTVRAFSKTYVDNSRSLRVTVRTPVVTKREVHKITATFVPTDNADAAAAPQSATFVVPAFYSGDATTVAPASYRTATASKNVTLLPRTADDNGASGLPGTGGPDLWYLILGALLLAAGATTLEALRRRKKNSV